ncbi:hypothetical protein [Saccharopolyspora sp. NPDC002686]|uniref:hypothetical protein n=1 Tax=Saccharopolyspora sp. NPDC002686 TaxID=3154541 RepID=UPI00331DF5B4
MRRSACLAGAFAAGIGMLTGGTPAFADTAGDEGINLGNGNNTNVAPTQVCGNITVTGGVVLILAPVDIDCVNAPIVDHPVQTPPVEDETPPVEGEVPPVEEETPPVEGEMPPVEEEEPPVENEIPPVENDTPPVEEETPPVPPVQETPPVQSETPPAHDATPAKPELPTAPSPAVVRGHAAVTG